MQQIKIFKGVETDVNSLESDVNGWLKQNGAKVVNIFGNIAPQTRGHEGPAERRFSPSDILITVVYEK